MPQIIPTNTFGCAKWIVSPTASNGTHTTWTAAFASASSGDTVFIRPGTYTENPTIPPGVNVAAFQCDALTPNVTLLGKLTMSGAGTCTISGINFQTNSDYSIVLSGSEVSILNLTECNLDISNNTSIDITNSNSSSFVNLINCSGDIKTTGIAIYTGSGGASTRIERCRITNSGGSTTANSLSAGAAFVNYSNIFNPFSTSSTGSVGFFCSFISMGANAIAVALTGTGVSSSNFSTIFSGGSHEAVTIGAGTTFVSTDTVLSSTGANVITGSGTLQYGNITFASGSSTTISVSTETILTTIPAPGFSSINVQTFTSTTTYTPSAGLSYGYIEIVGGGAAGGGADTSALSAGTGGGNGEYASGYFTASAIGASQSVTIGAGGTGVSAGTGNNGGTTSVGSLITAVGGTGGTVLSTNIAGNFTAPGGAGGTGGSGGSLRYPGANGGFAFVDSSTGINMIFTGGGNSGAFTGGAAPLTVLSGASTISSNGNAGTGYGGGGSGAIDYSASANKTGGAGSAGFVKITEYIN